ncbi:MAG: energy transducer TonB [Myxococcota bacterium]
MTARVLISVALGVLTAFALFWVMQALVSVSGELREAGSRLTVDFVRLRKDHTPEMKKREPPKREKPEQQPPPPEMNMAKAMNPGDAVGEIIPIVDTTMELGKATALGTGGGSDRDIVPLVRVDPDYPPRAKQQGIEGYVDLEFTISPVGTVQDAIVIGSQPPNVFDRAALRAVRKWRYNPKVVNGLAVVRANVQVRLRFTVPKGR